jgi:hypothetical protein
MFLMIKRPTEQTICYHALPLLALVAPEKRKRMQKPWLHLACEYFSGENVERWS